LPVKDVLTAAQPGSAQFAGAKPPAWTRWVLAAMGYDAADDEVTDLFHGSGAVAAVSDGLLSFKVAEPVEIREGLF
jgi:hypothetical protein